MANQENRYDIVIVGAGPVGILLSLCLSRWGYKVKHIDNRPVPTATGRADGIQPRSIEILRNLGLKRALMAYEPAKVYDVAFWDPLPSGKGITRTGNWPSCPRFIDTRYPFTALVHQGKIEKMFIHEIEKAGTTIQRPWTIVDFENSGKDAEYPVEVSLKCLDTNVIENVRAKYLFSGEGARSFVREKLGVKISYKDQISFVWGVMDGVVQTNFPDIKTKCTIHSDSGSIMVIPREDNMVRLYVQIASSTDPDWNPRKTATVEEVQEAAKKILQPYTIQWDRVEWYSVYPIGQGIAEQYTLDHRVFMGGDACHTHSPKAGQGMNTAFHDALNFAWKIHAAFTPTTVTRLSDANMVHLEQEVPANGSFRLFVFAGSPSKSKKALEDFASNIEKEKSFLSVYRRPDIADVSYFERHNPHSKLFTLNFIFASEKNGVDLTSLPQLVKDYHHHIYADDIPDVRVPHAKFPVHEKLGFNPEQGASLLSVPTATFLALFVLSREVVQSMH
uniref:Phenol 2-monooxygenase n=1 Tax=Talaromyces marneffei PM1 TaxID=1077442 RepID=A0A093UTB1_TALMA